jgi:aryl-alcohol dehydrogenase-like predicted oxidoreductase
LAKIADELSTNLPRLAIAWCLKNPKVSTVITGASRLEQVLDNLEALELVTQLDPHVMEQIEQILDNKPKFPQF